MDFNQVQTIPLLPKEREWLAKHPVIRVMSEPDYAPFDFIENNTSKGYSIDYVKLIAQKLGIQVEFVQDNFSRLMEKVKRKEIDVMHSLFQFPKQREEFLHFTRAYKPSVNTIVTRKGEEVSNGLIDMHGKVIAAVPGDAAYSLVASDYPEISLLAVKDYQQALNAVAYGKADGVVLELPVAHYLIEKLLLNNLSHASPFNRPEGVDYSYKLAVRKDWPELIPILEKAMASVTKAELKRLDERWLDTSVSHPVEIKSNLQDYSIQIAKGELFTIAGVLLVGLVVFSLLFKYLKLSKSEPTTFQFSSRVSKRIALAANGTLILLAFGLGSWALNYIKLQVKSNIAESLRTALSAI